MFGEGVVEEVFEISGVFAGNEERFGSAAVTE